MTGQRLDALSVVNAVALSNAAVIRPEVYGAEGDGATDDTTALQAWIDTFSPGGRYELTPGATYLINAGLVVSGTGFVLEGNGATIKTKNSVIADAWHFGVKWTGDGFAVRNLTVDGNRANRTPTETPCHSFFLVGCSRFIFESCKAVNAVCDGWYLDGTLLSDRATYPHHGQIRNCEADNSYRNGLSAIAGYDITIEGGSYDNSNGTAPQGGIDLESDTFHATPGLRSIRVRGLSCTGNRGPGLTVSGVGAPEAIFIDEVTLDGTGGGSGAVGLSMSANDVQIGGLYFSGFTTAVGSAALSLVEETRVNIQRMFFEGIGGTHAVISAPELSGNIGLISALDCASPNFFTNNDMNGLAIERVDMENCGSTSADGALIRLGSNCRLASARFQGCKGYHVLSWTGDNEIGDIVVDAPDVGQPNAQAVIYGANGDTLESIVIRDPVTTTSNAYGIRFPATAPARVGYIDVTGFAAGRNNSMTDSPARVVTGSATLTKVTRTLLYTGSGGHTITLAAMSGLTEGGDYEVVVIHAGSGALTVAAASGDTLTGDSTLAAGETVRYKAVVTADTWYAS